MTEPSTNGVIYKRAWPLVLRMRTPRSIEERYLGNGEWEVHANPHYEMSWDYGSVIDEAEAAKMMATIDEEARQEAANRPATGPAA